MSKTKKSRRYSSNEDLLENENPVEQQSHSKYCKRSAFANIDGDLDSVNDVPLKKHKSHKYKKNRKFKSCSSENDSYTSEMETHKKHIRHKPKYEKRHSKSDNSCTGSSDSEAVKEYVKTKNLEVGKKQKVKEKIEPKSKWDSPGEQPVESRSHDKSRKKKDRSDEIPIHSLNHEEPMKSKQDNRTSQRVERYLKVNGKEYSRGHTHTHDSHNSHDRDTDRYQNYNHRDADQDNSAARQYSKLYYDRNHSKISNKQRSYDSRTNRDRLENDKYKHSRNGNQSRRRNSSSEGAHDGNKKYRSRSNSPDRQRNNQEYSWGKKEQQDKPIPPIEKDKPNFGLSGKLTEDVNTFNGVVIKYSEPSEARKPKRRWRFYPFKGENVMPTLYIHRQSCYLIGRDRKVVDLPVDHPSCSKQHAALQYRLVTFQRDNGTIGKRIRPYLIDLESSNGTYVNNKKIEPKKYVELLERDVIKFGFSSREYVLLHENSKEDALDDDVGSGDEDVKNAVIKQEPK